MKDDGWYSFPPPEPGNRAARAVHFLSALYNLQEVRSVWCTGLLRNALVILGVRTLGCRTGDAGVVSADLAVTGWWNWPDQGNNLEAGHGVHEPDKHRSIADVASRRVLNQYQGGMCISGRLTMTERTPRHLISPLGPNWVGTDSAV